MDKNKDLFLKLKQCVPLSESYLQIREQIVLNNLGLTYEIANSFSTKHDREDIYAEGQIGLINAVDTFNIDLGFQFSTYATKCILNSINSYLDRMNKHLQVDSLDRPIYNEEDENNLSLLDKLSVGDDFVFDLCEKQELELQKIKLRKSVAKLPACQEAYINAKYYSGSTIPSQAKIAKALHISTSRTYQLEESAIERLRKFMAPKLKTGQKLSDQKFSHSEKARLKAQLESITRLKLIPRQQVIILSRYYNKVRPSYQKLADTLGTSLGSIESSHECAIRTLKKEINYERVIPLTRTDVREILKFNESEM